MPNRDVIENASSKNENAILRKDNV